MLRRYLSRRDNPGEILVIGALFFFPGLFLLFHHGTFIVVQQAYKYSYLTPGGVTAVSEHGAHVLGGFAVAVGIILFGLYVYLRRDLARTHVGEHGRERI